MYTLKTCKRPFTVPYLLYKDYRRFPVMTIICSLSFLNAVVDLCMVVGGGEGSLVNDPLSVTFKPKPRFKFTWCETLILKINIFLIATRCIILVLSILTVLSAYLTRRSEVSALSLWKGVGSWKSRYIFSNILMLLSPDLWYRCFWSIYNFSVFIHSFSSYLRQRNYGPARY